MGIEHARSVDEHRGIALLARQPQHFADAARELRGCMSARVDRHHVQEANSQPNARALGQVERLQGVTRVAHDVGARQHNRRRRRRGAAEVHGPAWIAIGQV